MFLTINNFDCLFSIASNFKIIRILIDIKRMSFDFIASLVFYWLIIRELVN